MSPEPVDEQVPVRGPTAAPDPGPLRRRSPGRRPLRRLRSGLARRRDVLAVISLGGALGSLARWAVAGALPHEPGGVPWSTVVTNVSGCFLLGVLMVYALEVWPPSRYVRPFAGVGVLGGYTTFSTAMLDTRALAVAGRGWTALAYLAGTTAAGLAAVAAALVLTRTLTRARTDRRRPR